MIVITGAAGFIGSVLVGYLNSQGITDIAVVDDMPHPAQFKNLIGKEYTAIYSSDVDPYSLANVTAIVHIGADSNTLTKEWSSLYRTNVESTRTWYAYSQAIEVPFIFTSSAAVYGNKNGPLNQYAFSKLVSEKELANATILRLFNVYGPNEYHKGRMASTIMHWYNQIQDSGRMKIFVNSERYLRDFVYVEDVAKVIHHFLQKSRVGTFDVGTGQARSFLELADVVMQSHIDCETIPMPDDMQAQYQTYTCADLSALSYSYNTPMRSIREGVTEYVRYLQTSRFY